MTNEDKFRRSGKVRNRAIGGVPFNALLGLAVAAPLCAATLPTGQAVSVSTAQHDRNTLNTTAGAAFAMRP